MQLGNELNSRLSPGCKNAMSRPQLNYGGGGGYPSPYGGGYGGYGGYTPPPQSILDHGGGVLSAPGIGAVGPGGVIPYD